MGVEKKFERPRVGVEIFSHDCEWATKSFLCALSGPGKYFLWEVINILTPLPQS